jgi:hypothetical protein
MLSSIKSLPILRYIVGVVFVKENFDILFHLHCTALLVCHLIKILHAVLGKYCKTNRQFAADLALKCTSVQVSRKEAEVFMRNLLNQFVPVNLSVKYQGILPVPVAARLRT